MTDYVRITSRRIYDGVSVDGFSGHVVIGDGLIRDVMVTGAEGAEPDPFVVSEIPLLVPIDERTVTAPGFVDVHSHSDLSLVVCPNAPSKLAQGVTTEIVGNCGFSAFPAPGYWIESTEKYGKSLRPWRSAKSYLDDLGAHGLASNVATLVGAGSIRSAVVEGVGIGTTTPDQVAAMCRLALEAVEHGAIGLSTGSFYSPGCFASMAETVSLLQEIGAHSNRVFYSTHIREESTGLLASLDEAIEIADRAQVPLHIAHFKAKGRRSWGSIRHAIEKLEKSHVQATVDVYPYEASMTRIDTLIPRLLTGFLFNGALTSGIRRSAVTGIELAAREREGEDAWERVVLAHVPGRGDLERLTIEEAAERLGVIPAEAVLDICLSTAGRAEIISHCLSADDVHDVVGLPYSAVASDGYALPLDGFGTLPHPRSFGTFPRFIHRYVSERSQLSLGEALRKSTSLPAQIAGLSTVGRLERGRRADLVVFDPENIRDAADYRNPTRFPVGISHVVMAGRPMEITEQGVVEPVGTVLTR